MPDSAEIAAAGCLAHPLQWPAKSRRGVADRARPVPQSRTLPVPGSRGGRPRALPVGAARRSARRGANKKLLYIAMSYGGSRMYVARRHLANLASPLNPGCSPGGLFAAITRAHGRRQGRQAWQKNSCGVRASLKRHRARGGRMTFAILLTLAMALRLRRGRPRRDRRAIARGARPGAGDQIVQCSNGRPILPPHARQWRPWPAPRRWRGAKAIARTKASMPNSAANASRPATRRPAPPGRWHAVLPRASPRAPGRSHPGGGRLAPAARRGQ